MKSYREIGISVYPDFDTEEVCKRQMDQASALGYTIVFTGFSSPQPQLTKTFRFVFAYAKQVHLQIHVDINDVVMKALQVQYDDLSMLHELGIPVLRVDAGIALEDIITMTKNPYGIQIEENLSNRSTLDGKMRAVKTQGCIQNYCACLNYYPRVNSALSMEYAKDCAAIAHRYGCRTGAFIGSLYTKNALNPLGNSLVSIEEHRGVPSHIQAMELFATGLFDYVLFGDSDPNTEELEAVSLTLRSAYAYVTKKERQAFTNEECDRYQQTYCVALPVYLEANDDVGGIQLEQLVMQNRIDPAAQVIRIMNLRKKIKIPKKNTVERACYALTIDNEIAPQYAGELEITLRKLPAVSYANVIGQVKAVGIRLLPYIQRGEVMFQFTTK